LAVLFLKKQTKTHLLLAIVNEDFFNRRSLKSLVFGLSFNKEYVTLNWIALKVQVHQQSPEGRKREQAKRQ